MQDKWPGEVYSRLLLMGQDYWNWIGRLGEKTKPSALSKIDICWDVELKVLDKKNKKLLRSIWIG